MLADFRGNRIHALAPPADPAGTAGIGRGNDQAAIVIDQRRSAAAPEHFCNYDLHRLSPHMQVGAVVSFHHLGMPATPGAIATWHGRQHATTNIARRTRQDDGAEHGNDQVLSLY